MSQDDKRHEQDAKHHEFGTLKQDKDQKKIVKLTEEKQKVLQEAKTEVDRLVGLLLTVLKTDRLDDFFDDDELDFGKVGTIDFLNDIKKADPAKYGRAYSDRLENLATTLDKYQQAHKFDNKIAGAAKVVLESLTLLLAIVSIVPFIYKTVEEYKAPQEGGMKAKLEAVRTAMHSAGHSFFESLEVRSFKDAAREIHNMHSKVDKLEEKMQQLRSEHGKESGATNPGA